MKILLLEDDDKKRQEIVEAVRSIIDDVDIVEVENWYDYCMQVAAVNFDLILLDLLVPRSPRDPRVENHSTLLADTTRGPDSKSYKTPAIVLTKFLESSEEFFSELNKVDINVISFDDRGNWKEALARKLHAARPKTKFEFLVICALSKEADAYEKIVEKWGDLKTVDGILCREIVVNGTKGAIVQLPRMGLVSTAAISAFALDRFEPSLICMSGICGGVPQESSIYDLLVTDTCHQHDVGQWSNEGFKSEHYDVQINANVRNRLEELVNDHKVKAFVGGDVALGRSEFPEGVEEFKLSMRIVATSSGSAVMAEAGKTASLSGGQRKLAGFDMEVYAVYEAARLSVLRPLFFAAKSVVDDGDKNKGDRFHRVGCLLSARFVVSALKSRIAELRLA
jgi:nucleoside phosphorylase